MILNKLLGLNRENREDFYREVNSLKEQGNFQEAAHSYLKAAKRSGAPGLYDHAVNCFLKCGDTNTPRKIFYKLYKEAEKRKSKIEKEEKRYKENLIGLTRVSSNGPSGLLSIVAAELGIGLSFGHRGINPDLISEDLAELYIKNGYYREGLEEYIKIDRLHEVNKICGRLMNDRKDIGTAELIVEIIEKISENKNPACKLVYKEQARYTNSMRSGVIDALGRADTYDSYIKMISKNLTKYLSQFPIDSVGVLEDGIGKAKEKIGKIPKLLTLYAWLHGFRTRKISKEP